MYNSQEIAQRIKSRAKQVGKPLGEVLASKGFSVYKTALNDGLHIFWV